MAAVEAAIKRETSALEEELQETKRQKTALEGQLATAEREKEKAVRERDEAVGEVNALKEKVKRALE